MDYDNDQDIEIARRRLRRQVGLCLSVLVGLFMLTSVDKTYPMVLGASGAEYNLLELSEPTTSRCHTLYVKFQIRDTANAKIAAAFRDVAPFAAQEAELRGDTTVVMFASYQLYHIGWFFHNYVTFVHEMREDQKPFTARTSSSLGAEVCDR